MSAQIRKPKRKVTKKTRKTSPKTSPKTSEKTPSGKKEMPDAELIEIATKFHVERPPAPKKKSLKQLAKEARLAKIPKAKKDDDEDAEGDVDADAEEVDYGDVSDDARDEDASLEGEDDEDASDEVVKPKKTRPSKLGPDEEYESGEDIMEVKANYPKIAELDVFDVKMLQDLGIEILQKKKLGAVPYSRRKVSKAGKIVETGLTKMRKYKIGKGEVLLPAGRRKDMKSPLIVKEKPVYRDISPEEMEKKAETFLKKLKEEWGDRYEYTEADLPYFSPREIVDYVPGKVLKKRKAGKYYQKSPVEKVGKFKKVANPWDKRYPIGTRVKFTDQDGVEHKGLVREIAKPGITVMSNRKEYKIKYTNESLSVISKSPKKIVEKKVSPTLRERYGQPVPETLREHVRKVYVELLKEIIDVHDTAAKSPSAKVDGFSMVPPMEFDVYVQREYERWRYATYADRVRANLDIKAIEDEAKRLNENDKNFDYLFQQVLEIITLTPETTGSDVLREFRARRDLTKFQSKFLEHFTREISKHEEEEKTRVMGTGRYRQKEEEYGYIERNKRRARANRRGEVQSKFDRSPKSSFYPDSPPKMRELEGKDLASLIANIIQHYINTSNYHSDANILIQKAINEGLENLDQNALKEEFEKAHLSGLKKTYDAYAKKYEKEFEKYQKARKEARDDQLSSIELLENEVAIFEGNIYRNHGEGKNIGNYLRRVLIPHIFMHGPLARHANFFRSKLANGSYQFSALTGANIAHYLPEFVMGINREHAEIDRLFGDVPEAWIVLSQAITGLLVVARASFMDSYAGFLDPTRHRKLSKAEEQAGYIADPLVKILATPIEVCKKESGTGTRPLVVDGKYVYKQVGRGKGKKKEQVFEDIPTGDLIICFSDDKFSCHSMDEVFTALAKNEDAPINLRTGKPYPKEFIDKFRERYDSRKNTIVVPQEPEDKDVLVDTPVKEVKVVERKETRKRHKPASKKTFKEISTLLLMGDEIEHLADILENKLDVETTEGTLTIPVTNDIDDEDVNVAVVSFDTKNLDVDDVAKRVKDVPHGADIYLLGVGATAQKNKIMMNNKLRKALTSAAKGQTISHIFYCDEEGIPDAFVDIVIDVEGVKVD